MLKTLGVYNSKEILSQLVPLPPKDTVLKFRFVNQIKSLANGKDTYRNEEDLMPIVNVPARDGTWHQIGAVTAVDKDGVPTCLSMVFPAASLGGLLVYKIGGNPDDDMRAHLLLNSPECVDSPFKDERIRPRISVVDDNAAAERSIAARKVKRKADNLADTLEGEDLTTALLILNLASDGMPNERIDRIAEYADKFPEVFLEKMGGAGIKANAQFRKALAAGVIAIDAPNHRVVFGSGSGNLMDGLHNLDTEVLANEWALRVQANPLLAESLDKEMEVAAAKKPAAKGAKK